MALSLPSKKIRALIIVVLAIFIAYFVSTLNVRSWFQSVGAKVGKAVYNGALESVSSGNAQSDIDTDQDGLKDWQEVLWGTARNNADTDGDGVKDGEEIEKGRDPSIKGPNDALETTRGISAASVGAFSQSVSTDPDNLTHSVSKDLFAKFMSLQTGGNLNEETQTELISSVISNIDPGSIPPRYTNADVIISNTNSTTLRSYGNEVASALLVLENNIKGNPSNTATLSYYKATIDSLRRIQVPGSLGLTHLQLLNNFNASYQMVVLLANSQNDPVKGLVAMKSLQSNTESGVNLFKNIASELQNNDIIFEKTEAGYIWNNYR